MSDIFCLLTITFYHINFFYKECLDYMGNQAFFFFSFGA